MARFKVTDPTSGKVAIINGDTPPTDADIEQIFASQSPVNQSPTQGGVLTGPLKKSGLYELPVIGGLIGRGIAEPIAKGIELAAEGGLSGAELAGDVTGIKKITGPHQTTFMAPEEVKQYQGSLGEAEKAAGGQGLETGLSIVGAKSVPGIIKTLPEIPGLLTKSGVGKKIGAKVTEATAKGATDVWNDFVTEAKAEVQKRLGQGKEYQRILNNRLTAETPASLETSPEITPQRLLDLRRQAANREPQGIFAKFAGKSPANQVDEVIRDIASKRLKEITKNVGSDITGLDKLYSLYSKVGSPATIAGGVALGSLAIGQLPVIGGLLQMDP